jgi:hypothetical protein
MNGLHRINGMTSVNTATYPPEKLTPIAIVGKLHESGTAASA